MRKGGETKTRNVVGGRIQKTDSSRRPTEHLPGDSSRGRSRLGLPTWVCAFLSLCFQLYVVWTGGKVEDLSDLDKKQILRFQHCKIPAPAHPTGVSR